MGLLSIILRLFRRKKPSIQSMQIDAKSQIESPKSMQIDLTSMQDRIKSDESIPQKPHPLPKIEETMSEEEIFKLGFAAGYTGKSIKNIEESLLRIESLMVTKDWMVNKFQDFTPKLMEALNILKDLVEKHEKIEEDRFNRIIESLNRLESLASQTPTPIKEDIIREVETIKKTLPLTPRMQKLINVVKTYGEISYKELAEKLGITTDSLRGLLSLTLRRTDVIERFEKENKGWVRYRGEESPQDTIPNSQEDKSTILSI